MKNFNLPKYIPFLFSCSILFLFFYEVINIEKIYDKYYILLYYKGNFYTVHNITIDTTFGKLYLKQFTPTHKIYSFRHEMSDPPYSSEYMGLQVGYNWYCNTDNYLEHDFNILGNKIKNIKAVTFYKSGSIEIDFVKQEIIIENIVYNEISSIVYSPNKNVLYIGSLKGGIDYIIGIENIVNNN